MVVCGEGCLCGLCVHRAGGCVFWKWEARWEVEVVLGGLVCHGDVVVYVCVCEFLGESRGVFVHAAQEWAVGCNVGVVLYVVVE